MTLKEKFDNVEIMFESQIGKLKYDELCEASNQCEQIADEFAIEFSEWCTYYRDKNRNVYGDMLHAKSKYDDTYTTKELLEIFKKEKGL